MKSRIIAILGAGLLALSAVIMPAPVSTAAPAPVVAAATAAPTQTPPTVTPTPTAEPGAAEPGALSSTETVPCPSSIAKGAAFAASGTEVEGQTYSCGVVVVPENYAQPDGRTIELFYLKLHSSSQSPAPDPLVYLSGGPGVVRQLTRSANPASTRT